MEHKFRNLWVIRHRVTGKTFSLFFSDIEPAAKNSEIYHTGYPKNMMVQIEPLHQCKRTSIKRGTADKDQYE
jgi:hypothetical protein